MNGQTQTPVNLESDLGRRVEQLLRLIEVNRSVAAQMDLDLLLQQIVDAATQLSNAEMGGLLVLSQDDERFQVFKVSGWPNAPCGFPSANGLLSLLLAALVLTNRLTVEIMIPILVASVLHALDTGRT